MDLLRKYFVPLYQAPDVAPGATPTEPPPADPAITSDPAADPPASPKMVPVDVMVREITPLRAKVRETEAELATSRRTIAEQNELLARLQNPNNPPLAPPSVRQPTQHPQPDDVDRRAAELLLQRDMQALDRRGVTAYGAAWGDTVRLLESFNLNTPEFISSVTEIAPGKSHEVLRTLTQDGEKLAILATLSPVARIAEITRMAMAPAAQRTDPTPPATPPAPAPKVSRAPAPPPPVEPSATKVKDWRADDSSEEEFTTGFNEMMAKRSARR
jgi:hypothetical protein